MPYIKQSDRDDLGEIVKAINKFAPENAGQLNYLFTVMARRYLLERGKNYQHINDIVGALEGCKLEMYRTIVGSYEDQKILENGDVETIVK